MSMTYARPGHDIYAIERRKEIESRATAAATPGWIDDRRTSPLPTCSVRINHKFTTRTTRLYYI
ncbi:hypothetical protein DAI22_06g020901 [Oryza sativa Japonica Group]|nr:hypothetical protein DAI22_06g020901 [Oryza sativa Japonica Group]